MSEASLQFVAGSVTLPGQRDESPPPGAVWDKRSACFRAPAVRYAEIVLWLREKGLPYDDLARDYPTLDHGARVLFEPRPYQTEALRAWQDAGGRGVVVLPTGSGKTHLAMMAIHQRKRATLVVAPTLDLVRQWYDLLRRTFQLPVGIVGGGDHRVEALTVTTYDSALIHMEHFGNRFGIVVFDECHHLPSESYSLAAQSCLAPFRLGLTATPERADGREDALDELIGPEVFRKDIVELSGEYLSDYDTRRVLVQLSPEERQEYESERAVYLGFIRSQGISFGRPGAWNDFIQRSSRSDAGRRAMAAYRRQREIAFAAPAKFNTLDHLLTEHAQDRTLVFTQDNATAYQISRTFLVPAITHQTKVSERSKILQRLREGVYRCVVTSKVLNEGVDVPEANVAIVMSGSGSVREHVQRLGRILRKGQDKHAVLYEVITSETGEAWTSERRRDHSAYR